MKRARKRSLSEELQRYQERLEKKWTARYGQPYPQTVEEMYRRGDKTILLSELSQCLIEREPIPEWLRKALIMAIGRGHHVCDCDTWDEIFGSPVQTKDGRPARGRSREAVRRERVLHIRIYDRIEQLKAQGEKVDKGLFEKVAAEFKISRARAEQIYYDNRAAVEATTTIEHIP
jgi:hypothetical protein